MSLESWVLLCNKLQVCATLLLSCSIYSTVQAIVWWQEPCKAWQMMINHKVITSLLLPPQWGWHEWCRKCWCNISQQVKNQYCLIHVTLWFHCCDLLQLEMMVHIMYHLYSHIKDTVRIPEDVWFVQIQLYIIIMDRNLLIYSFWSL